jgi:potassium channel subfamily K
VRCESPEEEGGEREDENELEAKQKPRRDSTESEAELAKDNEDEQDEQDEDQEEEDVRELELHLLRRLIELTIRLEAESRQMLLDSMEKGVPRTLLLADRNGEGDRRRWLESGCQG